jgi:hypothetical protein
MDRHFSAGLLRLRRPEGVRVQQRAHRRLVLRRRQRGQQRHRHQARGPLHRQEDEAGKKEAFLNPEAAKSILGPML